MGWVNFAHPPYPELSQKGTHPHPDLPLAGEVTKIPDRTGSEVTLKKGTPESVPFFCGYINRSDFSFTLPLHSLQWNKRNLVKTDCLPLGNRYRM